MSLLSNERINTGRQLEMDYARGLAVLFMILIHVQEYFFNEHALNSSFGYGVDFLGGIPAAPVFMFLMGVGIVYSKKKDPKTLLIRGFHILTLGYVLNLCRGALPNLFHAIVLSDSGYIIQAIQELSYVDIFQFSGLALITFAALHKFKVKPWGFILLLAAIIGANSLIGSYPIKGLILGSITGLIWGSNDCSFFPYLTWMVYPISGYLFALLLIRVKKKTEFYLITGGLAASVLLISYNIFVVQLGWTTMLDDAAGYYKHGFTGNIIALAFVLCWISALYFSTFILPAFMGKSLSRWSKQVSEIYVIHWLYIGWLVALMGYSTLMLPYGILLVLLILITSDALASYMHRYGKRFV